MANCQKCGARIDLDDEFCPDCGAKFIGKGGQKSEKEAKRPKAEDIEQKFKDHVKVYVGLIIFTWILSIIVTIASQNGAIKIMLFGLLDTALVILLLLFAYGIEKLTLNIKGAWKKEETTLVGTLKSFFWTILLILANIAWFVSFVLFVAFKIYLVSLGSSELSIDSISTYSLMPTELLVLYGSGFDSMKSGEFLMVRFFDDKGYSVEMPVSWLDAESAVVVVPPYTDPETGEFSSGKVNVMAFRASPEAEGRSSNRIEGFEIKDFPEVAEPPGTITLEYLTKLIEASGKLIGEISKVGPETGISTTELRTTIIKQREALNGLKGQVKGIMQDPTKSYTFGKIEGQEVKLDKDSLAIVDRIIAAQLVQISASNSNDITGYAVGGEGLTLEDLGDSFTKMFSDIGNGIKENRDTMTSVGGYLMAAGGFVSLVPMGQVAGPVMIGVGAFTWFAGLHLNTAFVMATDASVGSFLEGKGSFDALKKDVQEYMEEIVSNGIATWIAEVDSPSELVSETASKGSFLIDSLTLAQGGVEAAKKFASDAEASFPNGGDKPPTDGKYIVMVAASGEGQGTINSNPPGISCPGDCTEYYEPGTAVTLVAQASEGSTFAGWDGGGCPKAETCVVTIADKDIALRGLFDKAATTQCDPGHYPQVCPSGKVRCCLSGMKCCGGDSCTPSAWC